MLEHQAHHNWTHRRAHAVDGAAVVSLRGGDYELVCGRDFSIGYRAHSETAVELYVEESVT